MTIAEIYEKFLRTGDGFSKAVETHCGYGISRTEISRIAAVAEDHSEFEIIWSSDNWWCDEKN
jgi:hypothetical protein